MSESLSVLHRLFGYSDFRGQQQAIIDALIAGDNALVIMPTGGGKSLCYQIPSIVREGCGVVISPLIALMQDQVDALTQLGIRAGFLNSTQSSTENYDTEQQLKQGELDLLYIAPERLNQPRTRQLLQTAGIALFAIDEAHCVSQWGHDFRADYLQLSQLAVDFPSVPRIALTATADNRTQTEIAERLQLLDAQHFVAGFDRPNIHYQIHLKNQPKQQLLQFITANHKNDSGIVYCLSRKKTESIAQWLCEKGFTALPYHAGLPHERRAEHQQRFLREDNIIIVATIAFGMGIDKPDVRFVAHLDLPKSIEAYYQETGRAGRDGEPANAWMAYGLEDVIKLREMMAQNTVDESNAAAVEYKRVEYQKLEAMMGLCEIISCRRQALLHYFGEQRDQPCQNCDTCLQPVQTWDGTEAAQKAMSCVYRTEQRFGVSHLVDVLTGAATDKISQFNHQNLSVYGVGKELSKNQWRSVYRQLIAKGLLTVDFQQYNAIKLTETCRGLLRGEQTIALRKDPLVKTSIGAKTKKATHHGHRELWESLRACRTQLAKEKSVPPYVIFHDTVLVDMAERQPQTLDEFSALSGVGQSKLEQYGESFLTVIKDFIQTSQSDLPATVNETYQQLQAKQTPEDIAQQRQLAVTTIYSHIAQLIQADYISLHAVIELSDDDIKSIEDQFAEQDDFMESPKLKPVFEIFDEQYSYSILKCVYANLIKKISADAA